MALHHASKGRIEGFYLWDQWSAGGKKYGDSKETAAKWLSFSEQRDRLVTINTLWKMASNNGWRWTDDPESRPYSITRDGKLLPQSITADILVANNTGLAYDSVTQHWLQYGGNCWNVVADLEAGCIVEDWLRAGLADGEGYSHRYLVETEALVKRRVTTKGFDDNQRLIPFTNSVLDLDTDKLLPHSPDLKNLWCLPFDYDPAATCEPVIAWLKQCVNGDELQVELLRAYLKAVITGRYDLQRYLEIIGPGGSGKGTFQRLCTNLVGNHNVHVTELKYLENSPFEPARLRGKRLCVITDAEKYSGDVSILKAMTGCDDLRFEEKHKQGGGSFKFKGLVLIGANQAIGSSDLTSGLQRRRITVRFDNQIAPGDRRDMESEFQPYLSGVIAWALAMPDDRMKALLVETDTHVPAVAQFNLETLRQVNPLAAWAYDYLVPDPTAETPVGVKKLITRSVTRDSGEVGTHTETYVNNSDQWLYASYCQWHRDNGGGSKEISSRNFTGYLKDLLCNQWKWTGVEKLDRAGAKLSRFKGVRLRTEHDCIPPLDPEESDDIPF